MKESVWIIQDDKAGKTISVAAWAYFCTGIYSYKSEREKKMIIRQCKHNLRCEFEKRSK